MSTKIKGEPAIMMTLAATAGVFMGNISHAFNLQTLSIPVCFMAGILIWYVIFFMIIPKLEHATTSTTTNRH